MFLSQFRRAVLKRADKMRRAPRTHPVNAAMLQVPRHRFEGRIALITGGGTGLGRAVAELLSREGAHVAIAGRREEVLATAVDELAANGGEAFAVRCDVRSDDSCADTIEKVVRRYGRIDTIIMSAGIRVREDQAHESDVATWDETMETNYRGAFLVAKHAIPHLGVGSSIVFIASIFGVVVQRDGPSFHASKAGF
jgi:NAD(P)-dependent dehydrogenase (short-subunit alcohol dehydrogenase family)